MRKTLAHRRGRQILERETGFEPATSTLARSHSTTELLPLAELNYSESLNKRANERLDEDEPCLRYFLGFVMETIGN